MRSRQMAEEVLKGGATEEDVGGASASNDQGFEGMEALARAIELGEVTASTCIVHTMYIVCICQARQLTSRYS